jgi:uncharacterized membrane protein
MKRRFVLQAATLVGAALAALLLSWHHLPARIAIHWDLHGAADGWGAPAMLLEFPALMAVLATLWIVLPAWSPRRYGVERFGPTWWHAGLVATALPGFVQAVVLWNALGAPVAVERMLAGGIAVAVILLGNVLGKVRRNFWLGVRTPWTLADERVWYATHRLAGKTMVGGGVLALAALLAGAPAIVALASVVAAVLAPAGYSLLVHRRSGRAPRP